MTERNPYSRAQRRGRREAGARPRTSRRRSAPGPPPAPACRSGSTVPALCRSGRRRAACSTRRLCCSGRSGRAGHAPQPSGGTCKSNFQHIRNGSGSVLCLSSRTYVASPLCSRRTIVGAWTTTRAFSARRTTPTASPSLPGPELWSARRPPLGRGGNAWKSIVSRRPSGNIVWSCAQRRSHSHD